MTKTQSPYMVRPLNGLGVAVTSLCLFALCGGCTTNEPTPSAADDYTFDRSAVTQPDTLALERVTGARGEHLGYVRTEAAGDEGGSYQVYLDPDMRPAGYNLHDGQHYRPNGTQLESVGTRSRARGLGQAFDRRPEDIVVTPIGRHELAASGPLSPRAATVELGGSADEDAADEDDE